MLLLALLLCSLSITQCQASSTVTPQPVYRKQMQLDIQLYATQKQVDQVCRKRVTPNDGMLILACVTRYKSGRAIIRAKAPHDWCDFAVLKSIGHEVLHAMGFDHGDKYWTPTDFTWGSCGMPKFTATPRRLR